MADQRTYKMLLGDIEAGGSGGLPDYSEANDGDALIIENGEPAWGEVKVGGNVMFELTTTNYPSGSMGVGSFVYLEKTGESYGIAPVVSSTMVQGIVVNGNVSKTLGTTYNPVPTLDGYFLAFAPGSGTEIVSKSGGISDEPVLISGAPYFIITGDFSITSNCYA